MIEQPHIRTDYNYDRNEASIDSGLKCEDLSLAKQAMKEESDINVIVKRFGISGTLPSAVRMPTYADYDEILDFQSAMNAIRQAEQAFAKMPADVRNRFGNDPGKFVDFCSDEKNSKEAEELGLVDPRKPPHDQEAVAALAQALVKATPKATPPQQGTVSPGPVTSSKTGPDAA